MGFELLDASLFGGALIAFVAGVLSFLSPCVLPIVPPYLAYMGGMSLSAERGAQLRGPLLQAALFFVLGLSTVFVLLGLAASALGQVMLQYQELFGRIAGAVVLFFGLHFIGILRLPFLYRELRFEARSEGGSILGAYVLGLAFAFGWTPCIGPVLGSILALTMQEAQITRGMLMMLFYAIGLGVPFMLAAVFLTRAQGVMARLKRYMRAVEIVMGVLLLIIGLLLISGDFARLSFWILEHLPILGQLG